MKKIWLIFVILLGLSNSVALAKECSKLTITGSPDSAPSSWVRDGKLIGAAVEYVEGISRLAGVTRIEVKVLPTWADALQAVYRGDVDVIFEANWSKERERYLDYVRPSISTQFLNVVVRSGEAFELNTLEPLAVRSGAAPNGYGYGDGYFSAFLNKTLKLQLTPDLSGALDLLLDKKVDFVFGYENQVFSQLMSRNLGTSLKVLNTYPTRAEGFIAFSKRSPCSAELRVRFAQQVVLANAKYTFRTLMTKYREVFDEGLTRPQ